MTSIGSNIASSSGAGSSGGPLAPAKVSLTLEEQLQNFERIIHKVWFYEEYLDATFFKSVAEVVKELRNDPCRDIHVRDPHGLLLGTTPLHWAVLIDDRAMVHYILSSGVKVDINALAKTMEMTSLSFAIIGGNHEIVEDLLEYKANVFMRTSSVSSAFGYMVAQKDSMFGILKSILANDVNVCDKLKNTALHYAANKEYIDVVAYLLDEKADVNLRNEYGHTPLHYATEKGSLDVVTRLVQQNADVNVSNYSRQSPLHLAATNGATDIVSLLVQHGADKDALDNFREMSPFLYAIYYGRVDTSNALIADGVNVHGKDKYDNNALHLAMQAPSRKHTMVDIVKLLRGCDVDANAKNKQGYSPFFGVVIEGHTEVVKELLQSKEKIKLMEECNGQTAIQIAFDHGHEHIKRALWECDDVSRYVGDLYRDRQVYVDAANAILVGAALIASVTFASWLQPPLGYTSSYSDLAPSSSDINYVDVQHNVSLRWFWIFNTLSFYFAIGTVVFGARSVLPRRQLFIKAIVAQLHQNLLYTSILLACSVFCVIIAFGIAGCIVLTPTLKFQWYMIVPTIFGGLVCLFSLGCLFKSMVEDNLKKKREPIVSWLYQLK